MVIYILTIICDLLFIICQEIICCDNLFLTEFRACIDVRLFNGIELISLLLAKISGKLVPKNAETRATGNHHTGYDLNNIAGGGRIDIAVSKLFIFVPNLSNPYCQSFDIFSLCCAPQPFS